MSLWVLGLALAASPERARSAIESGKPHRAAKKATKQLDKGLDTVEEEDAWRAVLADATVAMLRQQPELVLAQWFLIQFPGHPDTAEVREMEAELALEQARLFDDEAVYLGLAREYGDTPSGHRAREMAEQLHYEQLESSPWGLRRFLLRYPRGRHAEEVRTRELDSAFAWADQRDSADAWLMVLESYPEHPQQEQIRERYRQTAWRELNAGEANPEQLWRFASEFSTTEEGREAAARGLEGAPLILQGLVPRPDGTVSLQHDLVFDFGLTPPSGFELALEVQVEDRPWTDTALAWAPALGLELEEVAPSELTRSGHLLTWSPALPLCSPSDEAIPVSARVMLLEGGEPVAERQLNFALSQPCEGAQRMVFSRLEDDLDGPVAVLRFDPAASAWAVEPVGWRIPEDWECSHASEVDDTGVTVLCGDRTVRAGWDGKTLWVRRTPEGLRRTERAAVQGLDDSMPLTLRGQGTRRVLTDPAGTTLATVGPREVVVTLPSAERAFGAQGPRAQTSPAIPPSAEVLRASGPPLPDGAMSSQACPLIQSGDADTLGIPGAGVVALDPGDQTQWGQLIVLPSPSGSWTCFEWQGHDYARSVAQGPGGAPLLLTLRQQDGQWTVDERVME